MSEYTLITYTTEAVDVAKADVLELESYWAVAKTELKAAQTELKAVRKAVRKYAPRVVAGVQHLNKNARGWAKDITTSQVPLLIDLTDKNLKDFGLLADEKDAIGDDVLEALWRTAIKIHGQKKPVTLDRLIQKSGL